MLPKIVEIWTNRSVMFFAHTICMLAQSDNLNLMNKKVSKLLGRTEAVEWAESRQIVFKLKKWGAIFWK